MPILLLLLQGCGPANGDNDSTQTLVAYDFTYQQPLTFGQSALIDINQLGSGSGALSVHFDNPSFEYRIDNDSLEIRPLSPGTNFIPFTLSDSANKSDEGVLTVTVEPMEDRQKQRFFLQASFGPTHADLNQTANFSPVDWLDQQFSQPTSLHMDLAQSKGLSHDGREDAWYQLSAYGPDQLRQRVAFALSEMFVVSRYGVLWNKPLASLSYYDVLVENAFGNYRDLLGQVSLHPAMGLYLTLINSRKPNEKTGSMPDENYAREVMQLMSIGLYELNNDGSPKLVNGKAVPSYTIEDVQNIARSFSGWVKADSDYMLPMVADNTRHDTDSKDVLGHHIPAGQTAEQEMETILDLLFQHPNTPPFFSTHLIQRLVTSNPSPEYVERVANVFIDNGAGVRGDIAAVVKAILLDKEALGLTESHPPFKFKEPVVALLNLVRATMPESGSYDVSGSKYASNALGQGPLRSPSVFNFFSPDYSLGDSPTLAPEAELLTWSQYVSTFNYMRRYLKSSVDVGRPNLEFLVADFAHPERVIETISQLFFGSDMPLPLETQLLDVIEKSSNPESSAVVLGELIASSDEFFVQD